MSDYVFEVVIHITCYEEPPSVISFTLRTEVGQHRSELVSTLRRALTDHLHKICLTNRAHFHQHHGRAK